MNQFKSEKELNQMIDEFPNTVIWQQKVASKKAWELLLNAFLSLAAILILYYIFFKDLTLKDLFILDTYTLLELLLTIVFSLIYIFFYYVNASNASSMVYSIYPKHISFEWKFFKKKKVDIPFNDITAVNLVGYENNKYYTLFFGTKKKYKIKKFDFDKVVERVHITFENIKQGKEVYELLILLQRKSKEPNKI